MGNFKIEITGTGGHGCDRNAKEGEPLTGAPCVNPSCPDCIVSAAVERLRRTGQLTSATFTHWPGQPGEVTDDLDKRVRAKGSFSPPPAEEPAGE